MAAKLLIIETSDKPGAVALAVGTQILAERRLDEARRHARDLAPAVAALLAEQHWRACDFEGIIVSRGPGSYTGLRVGIMSAKTLAYALGCRLLAIDTFAAIARQAPPEAMTVDVVADAQQDKVYVQRFGRSQPGAAVHARSELAIVRVDAWLPNLGAGIWATGPGLTRHAARLSGGVNVVAETDWRPRTPSLLAVGMERWQRGDKDDPMAVEPLYLRPSSAEEQWARKR